jgi:hypothetical protein
MADTRRARTILIREDTPLPANLPIESEAFLPGWRVVKNLDGYGLGQKIEEAKWYFFYLVGEIRAIALGREDLGTLRRAVKQILAKREGQKFNSLEVTEISSKRFLGIPFMSVTAHFRHIQQGICLVPAKNLDLRMPESGSSGVREERHGAVAREQYAALFTSSYQFRGRYENENDT